MVLLQGSQLVLASIGTEAAASLLPAYNGDAAFNMLSGNPQGITLTEVLLAIQANRRMVGGHVWRIQNSEAAIVGVAETALVPPPDSAWIALLLIRDTYQHQGLGTEAVTLLEHYLLSLPHSTRIGLNVLQHNDKAIQFWEKRGYQRVQENRDSQGHAVYQYVLSATP